jgi:ketosteroid isomerase-like protein
VETAAATAWTVFRKHADGSWKVVEDVEVRAG